MAIAIERIRVHMAEVRDLVFQAPRMMRPRPQQRQLAAAANDWMPSPGGTLTVAVATSLPPASMTQVVPPNTRDRVTSFD